MVSYWYCPNCKIELDGCHVTYEEKCEYCGSDVLSVPETISQEELDELIKAKADGRLVVLPCKVGDTVYAIHSIPNSDKKVMVEVQADLFFIVLSTCEGRFGKTVFLTREEAEKALQKEA